jgi:hypothetical protein
MEYEIGSKVVCTKAPYKGKVGKIIKIYSKNGLCYEIGFDEPMTVTIGGITFQDHSFILAAHDSVRLLTTMGEAIYATQETSDL